uniref:Uncharacterized protein n=1 Tax=Nothoprocta perdicaria TaxID=30464 RepID=A0A8C6YML9_NOTPE
MGAQLGTTSRANDHLGDPNTGSHLSLWPLRSLRGGCPHLDLARVLLAHGDDGAVDLQADALGEGHGLAAPVVVLHGDPEGLAGGRAGAARRGQQVHAGALEVVAQPVEGGVVRVAGGHAPRAPVPHTAALLGPAPHGPAWICKKTPQKTARFGWWNHLEVLLKEKASRWGEATRKEPENGDVELRGHRGWRKLSPALVFQGPPWCP